MLDLGRFAVSITRPSAGWEVLLIICLLIYLICHIRPQNNYIFICLVINNEDIRKFAFLDYITNHKH